MTSTLISAAQYHPDDRALLLCFVSGRRYIYLGVPPIVAADFARAESKGGYFNPVIKGRFACHELVAASMVRHRRAAND